MTWRFEDPHAGIEEDLDTEEEALEFLSQSIENYAEEARRDGEWPDGVEHLKVWKLTHVTEAIGNSENGYSFKRAPFIPVDPIPSWEGGQPTNEDK